MATYVITFSPTETWNSDLQFKYRYWSSDGRHVAQREFDRLRASGCKYARLIRWENLCMLWDAYGLCRFGPNVQLLVSAVRAATV